MRNAYTALGLNSVDELKAAVENGELSPAEQQEAEKILADD